MFCTIIKVIDRQSFLTLQQVVADGHSQTLYGLVSGQGGVDDGDSAKASRRRAESETHGRSKSFI